MFDFIIRGLKLVLINKLTQKTNSLVREVQTMTSAFKAILISENEGKISSQYTDIALSDLPDLPVLVEIEYSTLNYKDALAVSGKGKIARSTPMVAGIDLAGRVIESNDKNWQPGQRILVNGFGLSERHWGGYAQKARLKSEWLTIIPDQLTTKQAMAIGTAGYTAMLCIMALQDHGIKPDDGPILVTGASGGVGTIAITLLSKLGYTVVCSSGRSTKNSAFLKNLGASDLITREELAKKAKPLESEKWAGVIDSIGGDTLNTAISQTKYEGIVAACGLAGGIKLETTVMPFILRGVTLRGIDSVMASSSRRNKAWSKLAELIDHEKLNALSAVQPMSNIHKLSKELLAGDIRGRIIIDVNE